jgi:hypothetical protein
MQTFDPRIIQHGWRCRVVRHARRLGRGFRRGLDTRTIFVMRCPVTKEIYHVGYDPGPSAINAPGTRPKPGGVDLAPSADHPRSMTAGLRAISASSAILRRRQFAVAQAVERRDCALENAGNLANVG